MQVQSEQSCDQTEFLHPNGTCVACPVCGPGEQLSEDCGFGDGGEGVCMLCEGGRFSPDTSVAPCRRCTQCNLLNRLEKTACSLTSDALCGQCLPG
uniref:TNFR-Cys domain-containing protein n=1 Tax=Lates calcarifer TaxID=8187 RepID=A0A4W6EBC6_LATCA